jgi:hypothetical protein
MPWALVQESRVLFESRRRDPESDLWYSEGRRCDNNRSVVVRWCSEALVLHVHGVVGGKYKRGRQPRQRPVRPVETHAANYLSMAFPTFTLDVS